VAGWSRKIADPTPTWAEVTRKAEAMTEVMDIIAQYLPPDSGITEHDALCSIICAIETWTKHEFLKVKPRNPEAAEDVGTKTRMEENMATNKPNGDGHRNGAVKDRTQLKTKMRGEEHATKRDSSTGQFIDQKSDDTKFKGVRQEK
jgi:hypothetical protein